MNRVRAACDTLLHGLQECAAREKETETLTLCEQSYTKHNCTVISLFIRR